MKLKYTIRLFLVVLSFSIGACKDAWDEHLELVNDDNKSTLLERIAAEPDLSKFNQYLKDSGYDSLLNSSRTFTVWVPTNRAIDSLNSLYPDYLSNRANLKNFIEYHIVNLTFPAKSSIDTLRAEALNGKYVNMIGKTFEEANIVKENLYAKNGVLHIIDNAVPVKSRIWTIINNYQSAQLDSMKLLDTLQIGAAGDTTIKRSPFWSVIANNLNAENRQLTYFILEDQGVASEINKLKPYYLSSSSSPDSTQKYLTKINYFKDLIVQGVYKKNDLPDTLISVYGVKIPISKANIVRSIPASNGIVHVIRAIPFRLKDKIPVITIQGENPIGFRTTDKRSVTYYRTKADTLGGIYKDIEMYGHNVSEYYIDYRARGMNSVKYRVYARAVSALTGDSQTTAFTQRFSFADPTNGQYSVLFTHLVNPRNFLEVSLGEYPKASFGTLNFRLLSANVTTAGVNTLMLDYIRFEPVLP